MNAATALQVNEEYATALSTWEDKVNAAYLIFVMTIIDRLQAPIRQVTSPTDA